MKRAISALFLLVLALCGCVKRPIRIAKCLFTDTHYDWCRQPTADAWFREHYPPKVTP